MKNSVFLIISESENRDNLDKNCINCRELRQGFGLRRLSTRGPITTLQVDFQLGLGKQGISTGQIQQLNISREGIVGGDIYCHELFNYL